MVPNGATIFVHFHWGTLKPCLFLVSRYFPRHVRFMMESKLEDILQSAGVDPSTASQLVADGWTLATFACSAVDIQDFDKPLDEMVPGQHLTLLERSQLRAASRCALHKQI